MSFFKDERKRISDGYHKFLIGIVLFFYFIQIQSEISYNKVLSKNSDNVISVSFISGILIIFLIFYLSEKLFWIKEQGHKVFIIRKYDSIPISKKEIYISKFKVIVYNSLIFMFGAIIIYIGTLIFNDYFHLNVVKDIFSTIKFSLFIIILIMIIFTINIFEDYRSKRKNSK